MERRCRFLDNMPAYNYNTGGGEYVKTGEAKITTDTKQLGSTLMETMLKEVADFCDPKIKESWTQKGHQQVWKGTGYTFCKICVYWKYNKMVYLVFVHRAAQIQFLNIMIHFLVVDL